MVSEWSKALEIKKYIFSSFQHNPGVYWKSPGMAQVFLDPVSLIKIAVVFVKCSSSFLFQVGIFISFSSVWLSFNFPIHEIYNWKEWPVKIFQASTFIFFLK